MNKLKVNDVLRLSTVVMIIPLETMKQFERTTKILQVPTEVAILMMNRRALSCAQYNVLAGTMYLAVSLG